MDARQGHLGALAAVGLALVAGCGEEGAPPAEVSSAEIFPDPDWRVESAAEHGLDQGGLEAVALYVGEHHSDCLLVVHGGVLVGEWYWREGGPEVRKADVFSVTKSITSALVGIAQGEGRLSVDDPASKTIEAWRGTPSEGVTIRQILGNESGRRWDFATDYLEMAAEAPDKTAFAIGLDQQHGPGEVWEYNNSAIQVLERVLEVSTGEDPGDYARRRLFEPLGMGADYGRDEAGNALMFAGVGASCRDLARFGLMILREGRWVGGLQVVPAQWVRDSTQPSTALNAAYGWMWWLNQEGPAVLPSTPLRREGAGPLVPSAPLGLVSAIGIQGQIVAISPADDLVVVRLGDLPFNGDLVGDKFLGALWERLEPALPGR